MKIKHMVIGMILIGVFSGIVCFSNTWLVNSGFNETGSIEGTISVCNDGQMLESADVFLECVEDTHKKPYEIQKRDEDNQIKYAIPTDEKAFYKITLKLSCDHIGLNDEKDEWVQYNIFIFNLAGKHTVKADIDIDIHKDGEVYEFCCTVTALRNEKEVFSERSILNEQKDIEIQIGP